MKLRKISYAFVLAAALSVSAFAGTAVTADHQLVKYGNVQIDVMRQGQGPVIVMLPSLGRSVRDYDQVAERLVADGFRVLHPGKRLAGRAFTVQFMPVRPDLDTVVQARAKTAGLGRMYNQAAIDMLQPGDVLVVDLFGQEEGGTIVGDNLFYYIMKATKGAGLVVDGAIRDLEGIQNMDMPAYFRSAHPSAISNVMITGINVPVRIGKATVMPGDVVFGDAEGVYFIPPALVEQVVDNADEIHIHDEWTRMKFDEGKYKSGEIYGTPKDPALLKEYQEYLKKRLEEIRKKNPK